ncbi:MAG: hypothetical protein HUJ68_09495 [Clostridia bacterium]|nr:hypothetical protein [Clostridia bacterium]
MNKLIRIYNQNRKQIWKFIGIIAFLIIILQLLNWWVKKSNKDKLGNMSKNNNTIVSESSNNQIQISSQNSAINGNKIDNEVLNKETSIITNFLEECNNGKIESAYNMITEECKEELYPSISDFKIYYCGNFFNEPTWEILNAPNMSR